MLLLQQTSCVVLFLPIFLLKAMYDDRKGAVDHWQFDTKKSITTCLKLDMPGIGGCLDPRAGLDAVEKRKF
jgi:hypothetical protein